jgi:hypothetical protein
MSDRKRVVRDYNMFFQRHQDRQYRVRRASPVEIRQKELNGGLPTLPQGLSWFLVIWSPARGRRICLFIPNREDVATDLDEGTAHAVFDYAADAVETAHAPLTPRPRFAPEPCLSARSAEWPGTPAAQPSAGST